MRRTQVGVVAQFLGVRDGESPEVRVAYEFVSWDHAVGSQWHNLAVLVDEVHHDTQPIQFGKVLGPDHQLLPIDTDAPPSSSIAPGDNLFVLPRE